MTDDVLAGDAHGKVTEERDARELPAIRRRDGRRRVRVDFKVAELVVRGAAGATGVAEEEEFRHAARNGTIGAEGGSGEPLWFESPDHLKAFVDKASRRIAAHSQCFTWEGYELEILGVHGLSAARFPEVFELINDGRFDPLAMITRRLTLDGIPSALPAMAAFSQPGVAVVTSL